MENTIEELEAHKKAVLEKVRALCAEHRQELSAVGLLTGQALASFYLDAT